jgi:spoIIIJ-associated protein
LAREGFLVARNEIIETGKTVDAVIETACEKLGCNREDCEWEIIDLPKRGFLGLRNTPAKVRVWVETPDPVSAPAPRVPAVERRPQPAPRQESAANARPAPQQEKREQRPPRQRNQSQEKPAKQQAPAPAPEQPKKPQPRQEAKPEASVPAERPPRRSDRRSHESDSVINPEKTVLAKEYILSILIDLKLEAELTDTEEDGGVCINIVGKGLGAIIGRRGETLDALQYLASLVANRIDSDYMRITIDCGDYRAKRRETLEALAKKLAAQVIKTNVSRTLEPMNPFERRIIHATVSEIEGVSSTSVGEEPNRRVIITSPGARSGRPGRPPRFAGRDRDRDDRPPRAEASAYASDEAPKPREEREERNDRYPDREQRYSRGDREREGGFERSGRGSGREGGRRDGRGGRDSRDSRGGGRGPRRDRPSQTIQSKRDKNEPPKQTPESTSTDKPLYTKIDLD